MKNFHDTQNSSVNPSEMCCEAFAFSVSVIGASYFVLKKTRSWSVQFTTVGMGTKTS